MGAKPARDKREFPVGLTVTREHPTHAVPQAAELTLGFPRQDHDDLCQVPLKANVILGQQTFKEGDFGFTLRFRSVYVALRCERCTVSGDMRYIRSIPREDFVRAIKKELKRTNDAGAGGRAGVDSSLLSRLLPLLGFHAEIHGKAEISSANAVDELLERVTVARIVTPLPDATWCIGLEGLGDPQQHAWFLEGTYLSQSPDVIWMEDDDPPLCLLEPGDGATFTVTIELRARDAEGSCAYLPLGRSREDEDWVKDNKERIERLLLLKQLREQNHQDGLDPPEGELILARGRLSLRKTLKKNE